ncbi:MAG: hypothetical protein K9M75_02170 [Phycisphaerae bacterium]|nr:hypothetical protein [Phycisphaerae bacterium]
MKTCPYCFSEIVEQALKCKHCGEWVTDKPASSSSRPTSAEFKTTISSNSTSDHKGFFESDNLDNTLNEGIKMYAAYKIIGMIVGAIIFLIFLFAVFIPAFNKTSDPFNHIKNSPDFKDVRWHKTK